MNAATPDPAPTPELPGTPGELKRVLEAVLLSAKEPLSLGELRKVFDDRIGALDLAHDFPSALRGPCLRRL